MIKLLIAWIIFFPLITMSNPPPRDKWELLFVVPDTIFTSAIDAFDSLMVSTQDGRIYRLTTLGWILWADMRSEVDASGEGGLNALATDGQWVYALLVNRDKRIVLWSLSITDPKNRGVLWDAGVDAGPRHNAGGILLSGGSLYIGIGDQAPEVDTDSLAALDPDSFIGKVVRLNLDTRVADVHALGFRNPWQIILHDDSLWVIDVGQQRAEELNHLHEGATYGWPCFEGLTPNIYSPDDCGQLVHVLPAYSYGREGGMQAIVGAVNPGRWLLFDFSDAVIDTSSTQVINRVPDLNVSAAKQLRRGVIALSFGGGSGRVWLNNLPGG